MIVDLQQVNRGRQTRQKDSHATLPPLTASSFDSGIIWSDILWMTDQLPWLCPDIVIVSCSPGTITPPSFALPGIIDVTVSHSPWILTAPKVRHRLL